MLFPTCTSEIIASLYARHGHLLNAFNMPTFVFQMAAEPPKLAEYQTYIDYEQMEGDPARIQIIFERALAENCLVPDMWAKYTKYLVSVPHPFPLHRATCCTGLILITHSQPSLALSSSS